MDEEATATEQFMAVVDQAARAKEAGAPKYALKAWFILDRDAFPRKQCIQLVEWPMFDHIILVLIAANCLTMMVRPRASPSRLPTAAALALLSFLPGVLFSLALSLLPSPHRGDAFSRWFCFSSLVLAAPQRARPQIHARG